MTSNTTILRDSEVSTLTDSQERTLSSLTIVSSCFSILGSSIIVYLVLKNSRRTPYKRILLGLSVADIISSVTWILSPFLQPSDTSQRVWARGNDASCTLLGFLFQLSLMTVWYNGMLSYYYLITIRFRVKATTFATKYEPWVHGLSIGFNVVAAIVGSSKGYYSEMELGQGCYIAEYPEGCELTGGCTGAIIGWIVSGVPAITMFLSILINNVIIYCHVRQTTNRTSDKSLSCRTKQNQRIQAVATQAMLYVGTFLMAYIWIFVIRVAESLGVQAADEARLYPILVLSSIFLPLQGVLNLLVYSRPNYLRIRLAHPTVSRWQALHRAWFGEPNARFTSIDGTLASRNHSRAAALSMASTTMGGAGAGAGAGEIVNVDEVRLRVSQLFSATYSGKDPLRRDIRMRDPIDGASSVEEQGRGKPSQHSKSQPYPSDGQSNSSRRLAPQSRPESSPLAYQYETGEAATLGPGFTFRPRRHDPTSLLMVDDGTADSNTHSLLYDDMSIPRIATSNLDVGPTTRVPSPPHEQSLETRRLPSDPTGVKRERIDDVHNDNEDEDVDDLNDVQIDDYFDGCHGEGHGQCRISSADIHDDNDRPAHNA